MAHALESPLSQKDSGPVTQLSSARLMNDLNIPMKTKLADSEDDSKVENASLNPQPQQQGKSVNSQVKMWHRKNETSPGRDPCGAPRKQP